MHANPLRELTRVAVAAVVAAVASATLVAVSASTAGAAAVPCRVTYPSGTLNLAIPDNGVLSAVTIDVPENGLVVSDVDVTLNIQHTSDEDLKIWLYSRADDSGIRQTTTLFDRFGGTGDNLAGTVFDDEAGVPINWGSAPFTGRFMPFSPLAASDGDIGGKYQVYVADVAAGGGTGSLTNWSLTLTYQSCDLDSDGVEDHRDSCLGVDAHTATGCPLTTRTLTAKYRLGKFKGALSSPVAGCKANRAVTIWKQRSGADRKIGTATSASDGRYKLRRAKKRGKYYATSPRVAVTGVAECPAVKSATFRIR